MTPRPNFTHKQRPLSAIYIGSLGSNSSANTASPPDLPKLPEPPSISPGSSSGLPSPPATNSTGSGSVGDEGTDKKGSVRQRPSQRPLSTSDMYNGIKSKVASDMSSASTLNDDDELNDENDEDDTARFSLSRTYSTPRTNSTESMSALQRVKSLTERNRQVLDKLTSISRHGSPVPGSSSKTSVRSPLSGGHAPSPSLGAGASRLSTPSRLGMSRPRPQSSSKLNAPFPSSSDDRAEPGHSGSETERETTRTYSHTHSSSDSLSNTPTSSYTPSDFSRPRRTSAPTSPKSPRKNIRRASPSATRTPRKRASMAVSVSDVRRDESDDEHEDIAKAALAAVAMVRRSPGSMSKRNTTRQPLPHEFRDGGRRSVLGDRSEPATPQKERFLHTPRSPSPSRYPSGTPSVPGSSQSIQRSPRRPTVSKHSTVRELTRRHQTRWLSEDLSAASIDASGENDTPSRPHDNSTAAVGRRQGHRTGSSESPFGGRTLLGEGLRAAGLAKKKDDHEANSNIFANGQDLRSPDETSRVFAIPAKRTRSTGATSAINGQGEWDSPSPVVTNGRVGTSSSSRPTFSSSMRTLEARTPSGLRTASGSYVTPIRPNTSMAAFHHDVHSLSSSRPSSYRAPREHEASTSAAMLDEPIQLAGSPHAPDRAYTSLSNHAPPRSSTGEGHPEHRKLLSDALGMFESQLSRLPPMGHTTTVTIPEVFQNSQTLVQSLDKLNDLLRGASGRALDSQVLAEVGDVDLAHLNLSELWSDVLTDHRDHLRLTEEIGDYDGSRRFSAHAYYELGRGSHTQDDPRCK
ncbi:hypothetical protein NM688_g8021 [Phlebia brevispora]|uniref:Uncharacterized protein n=1 Tax=Phlebia brevispora TaxID=194682 RepID=A0ACC1RYK3_9APHY|nr:hypothetical protein NM688_g8021 [Phlebia brevispora]